VGLSFIGEAWSEAELLSFAFAYETQSQARVPPTYARSVEDAEPIAAALRQPDSSAANVAPEETRQRAPTAP
jgi:Asp-tRNA(Asn)/Glu-tRNA(Gln) amidotransferase A subunit family amidase